MTRFESSPMSGCTAALSNLPVALTTQYGRISSGAIFRGGRQRSRASTRVVGRTIAPEVASLQQAHVCHMTNIPTELMRTLLAVVDLRSFTKAAQSMGVTQPAVSAQIKRLQNMLGCELF